MVTIFKLFIVFSIAILTSTASAQQRLLFPVDLHPGVKNEVAVIILQKFLKAERYYDGPLFGIYDAATGRAVERFQQEHNIRPSDGVFKGLTRTKANAIIQEQLASYTTPTAKKEIPKVLPPKPKEKPIVQKPQQLKNCFVAGNMLKHGDTRRMYRYETAPQGATCHSESRTCDDGFVDGNPAFRYMTCNGVKNSNTSNTTTKSNAPKSDPGGTCIQGQDSSGKPLQLCAITAENGRCANANYPCAFIGPNSQKACFAKVDGKCPRVPKTQKK